MNELYVTDLDGTLLNRQDRVSPFSVRVINELAEKGLLFTYATARSLVSASRGGQSITVLALSVMYKFIPHAKVRYGSALKAALKARQESLR